MKTSETQREENIAEGRRVLSLEAMAVNALSERLDASFSDAVELMFRCQGRVVITGLGKSGHIGKKIAGGP